MRLCCVVWDDACILVSWCHCLCLAENWSGRSFHQASVSLLKELSKLKSLSGVEEM